MRFLRAAGSKVGCSYLSSLAMSASVSRWKGASPSSLGGAGQVTSTILPASLPFQSSKSLSFVMGATMMGAFKTPFVAGVHASGMARKSKTRGAIMRTCEDSIHQPRPKSKASDLTSFNPQPLNFSCVHRSALRMAGELVMRPPISSARYAAISTTSLWLNPTSEIRLIVIASADKAAFGGTAAAMGAALKTMQAQKTHSFVNTAPPCENLAPHRSNTRRPTQDPSAIFPIEAPHGDRRKQRRPAQQYRRRQKRGLQRQTAPGHLVEPIDGPARRH